MAKTLLILDDEECMRTLYSQVFSGQGYAIHLAGSLAEALKLLEATLYDLVITDLNLEDGRGTDLVMHLRVRGLRTKTILISGSLTPLELLEVTQKNGIQACFEKPFSGDDLLSMVRTLLPS